MFSCWTNPSRIFPALIAPLLFLVVNLLLVCLMLTLRYYDNRPWIQRVQSKFKLMSKRHAQKQGHSTEITEKLELLYMFILQLALVIPFVRL